LKQFLIKYAQNTKKKKKEREREKEMYAFVQCNISAADKSVNNNFVSGINGHDQLALQNSKR
jgi:hypothetical protein